MIIVLASILSTSAYLRGDNELPSAIPSERAEKTATPSIDGIVVPGKEDAAFTRASSYDIEGATVTIDPRASSTSVIVNFTYEGMDFYFEGTSYDPPVQSIINGQGVILIYDVASMVSVRNFYITYVNGGLQIEWGLHAASQLGTGLSATGSQAGMGTWF